MANIEHGIRTINEAVVDAERRGRYVYVKTPKRPDPLRVIRATRAPGRAVAVRTTGPTVILTSEDKVYEA